MTSCFLDLLPLPYSSVLHLFFPASITKLLEIPDKLYNLKNIVKLKILKLDPISSFLDLFADLD